MYKQLSFFLLFVIGSLVIQKAHAQPDTQFKLENVFDLEYVSDPQISPGGQWVVYQRNSMDIMEDREHSNLWLIDTDGSRHRPLTSMNNNVYSPRWSPSGDRLLYVSTESGSSELYIRWMDTGESAKITNLTGSPGNLSWSPDGKKIAFTMFVPQEEAPMVSLPGRPEGAEWAEPANVIDDLQYRRDGASGFVKEGYRHVFTIPAEGGTPRQITSGDFNHSDPAWMRDNEHLVLTSNRKEDWEYKASDTELYKVSLEDGDLTKITDRRGPDSSPVVSPGGDQVAYLGYDDNLDGYQITNAYVINVDGTGKSVLTAGFDRSVGNIQWGQGGEGLYLQYDDEGNGKVGYVSLDGNLQKIADNLGGTSLGRPYGGGAFSASSDGLVTYTYATPKHPADVALIEDGEPMQRLTNVNEDLLGHKTLGEVEEIWYESSFDGQKVQGWIIKPPNFDPQKKYPLILEIHGGPFANYGDRFTAELQLMAAAGYVVLYTNPRGSTSYGKAFGNYIHHNYPSEDYDDLMSGVDAVIDRGYIDADSLYITGGSGGGVLTAWSIGKTDRFNAAVVAKPVINWYSFVLTSDGAPFFYKYWFPGLPWNNRDHYMDRSPISLVGNVTTPTMLLTGEEDYRTPMSETEQYYTALQLQKVESVMVRIPGSGHGITSRPSNLMSKVAHILAWFDNH
ncbi:alpha/beta hydrolase family protein [Fodinibius salsisoli]|uniref:S9 family peptidase n=1 Tax=Fodinibius salsisoli TaxID=2820877 RepID=A0ABT3PRD2_9BACT|nr:S9 family peptidase [Fodinibius salsisoli]MCW9708422.1 S9 family peptidase [Fodinibius salsisoli]